MGIFDFINIAPHYLPIVGFVLLHFVIICPTSDREAT